MLGEPAERDATSLMEALDEHAIHVGAFRASEAAEEARRAAAEERRLEVMAMREAKRAAAEEKAQDKKMDAKLRKAETAVVDPVRETVEEQAIRLLPRLYAKAGQLPIPVAGTQALKDWLTGAAPMLDSCQAPLRMAMANAIYRGTVDAGWPENLAGGFAKACAGPALQAAA